jgi:hypothetical protein
MNIYTLLFFLATILISCSSAPNNETKLSLDSISAQNDQIMQVQQQLQQVSVETDSLKAEGFQSRKNDGIIDLGYDYTAPYICPNHCKGSGSEKSGICKTCGMELMKNHN